jgi:hypothetical protein
VASTKKLIDDWTDAGLSREQATRMALALDDHLEAKVVDKTTLRAELAELKNWLLLRVIGLVVLQLGVFWAISRFAS